MCNLYNSKVKVTEVQQAMREIARELPKIISNMAERDEIKPTNNGPVLRLIDGGLELVELKWGFPPPRPKAQPVINFRSKGRRFPKGRCLLPASSFFEFTGTKYPKTRWRFSKADEDWFCIAGLWPPAVEGSDTLYYANLRSRAGCSTVSRSPNRYT